MEEGHTASCGYDPATALIDSQQLSFPTRNGKGFMSPGKGLRSHGQMIASRVGEGRDSVFFKGKANHVAGEGPIPRSIWAKQLESMGYLKKKEGTKLGKVGRGVTRTR